MPTLKVYGYATEPKLVQALLEKLGQVGPGILDPADHGVAVVNLLAMDRRVLVSEMVIEPRRT